MGRANLAIGLALVASAVWPAVSVARKFHYSHRVSISGSLVDHWTINDTRSCGPVGDGTMTVQFHQKRAAKARVEYSRVEGRWEAFVPAGGLLGGLPREPVVGTLSLVDNTVAGPPTPGFDCSDSPLDKSGCGTSSLGGKAASTASVVDSRPT